jgi:hypothetical protein
MPATNTSRAPTRILLFLGIPLLLFLASLFAVNMFGYVSGVEVSPYTFKRRKFYYYEIPGLEIQIWSVKRSKAPLPTIDYLRSAKMLPAAGPDDRWDLVQCWRGLAQTHDGDADILIGYLESTDENHKLTWVKWTQEAVPSDSQYLWSAVAQLARRQLYIVLPDVFRAATDSPKGQVAGEVKRVLLARYTELALIKQNNEEHQHAIELFDYALELDGKHALAVEGRARSSKAE